MSSRSRYLRVEVRVTDPDTGVEGMSFTLAPRDLLTCASSPDLDVSQSDASRRVQEQFTTAYRAWRLLSRPEDQVDPYALTDDDKIATVTRLRASEHADAQLDELIRKNDERARGMRCARCLQYTGNNSQGHYWAYCKVTETNRTHHFCCPDNCELEADK